MSHLSLYTPRKSFAGRSDKYGRSSSPLSGSLDLNFSSSGPYDVTGVTFGESDLEDIATRIAGYAESQRMYDGLHWAHPYEAGEEKPVYNFCRTVVDKASDWMLARGWSVNAAQGNEGVANYLNDVWKINSLGRLTQRATQSAAVKGDSYYYVTLRTKDRYGVKLPRSKWTCRIQSIAPEYVFPVWSDGEERVMKACLMQFPVRAGNGKSSLYTIWITPKKIQTFIDSRAETEIDNPIGEVNVVHCPNFEQGTTVFGSSDIHSVESLNREYNTIAMSVRETIRYHAEPTTIIYGARASSLEKGAKSVWSGLPKPGEAKVENLQLDSDLEACFKYMDSLFTQICQLSSTPKVAFDSFDVRVASAATSALELMFQPLVEKTRRRREPHTFAVREINRLILSFEAKVIRRIDFEDLADSLDALEDTGVEYTSQLPRDEASFLDLAIKRVSAGVWSRAEMIRQCAGVKDYPKLVLELIADKRAALMEAYDKQKALQGERPSSLSAFLGSEVLSEELQSLQNEIAILEKEGAASK